MSATIAEDAPVSPLRLGLERFAGNRTALVAAALIMLFILAALAVGVLVACSPLAPKSSPAKPMGR